MDNFSEGTFSNPQNAGFQTILFNGKVTDKSALLLIEHVQEAIRESKKGVWVGIKSDGGVSGAARFVYDYLSSIEFPAISHAIDSLRVQASPPPFHVALSLSRERLGFTKPT